MRRRLRGDAWSATNRWRSIALLAIGFAVATLAFATPATSHVGGTVDHLWKHLRPKADARYYTKPAADAQFVNDGAAAGGGLDGTYPNPTIGKDAVGSDQIADRQIRASDLAVNAINHTAFIADGVVRGDDIMDNTIESKDLKFGSVGASQLASHIFTRTSAPVIVAGNTPENGKYVTRGASVACDSGEVVLGGGAQWDKESFDDYELMVVASHPSSSGGWFARGGSDLEFDTTFVVYAICLSP